MKADRTQNDLEELPLPEFDAPQRPVLLTCPQCKTRKIDKGALASAPHNSHSCRQCGFWWALTPDWTIACTLSGFILIAITNWLLAKQWITKKVLGDECPELGPLLIRYTIFKTQRLGAIYLHKLLRTDPSPLHDHPWSFVTILLSSGYTEETKSGKRFYKPGWILRRPAHYQHRVEIDLPAWSLVFAGPRKREWGFWPNPNQFIPFQQYDAKAELCPED